MSASVDGRFFVTDDFINGRIYVGSLATGRMMPLCDTGATCASPQATHPHPYMTPGNRHVIFNSDRTGLAQVWAAEVPGWFLEVLEDN
jgi:Tol biopolymer transport system component